MPSAVPNCVLLCLLQPHHLLQEKTVLPRAEAFLPLQVKTPHCETRGADAGTLRGRAGTPWQEGPQQLLAAS